MSRSWALVACSVGSTLVPAAPVYAAEALTPRAMLVQAAYATSTKAAALVLIDKAVTASDRELQRNAKDREAALQHAIATGYKAKLTRSLSEAKTSKRLFESLAAADPNDPEAQIALAGWHLEAVHDVGSMIAGAMLGAKKKAGLSALDRAVALGGGRSLYAGYAALLRIVLDSDDVAAARTLAEKAANGNAPTPVDKIMKINAARLLVPLRAGDGSAAAKLAEQLLPFGRMAK
ncbi:hypothetical protein [Flavisphingomonas formosensis]|uniref:hypothetical protein n=1 Tax=Flavisphingomonas formosensis TaxID=861534 RepID=UPI0012F7F33A|nr:hypothetical protein [Sphingomonas formosensis]